MFVYTVISLVPPPLPLRKKALVLDHLIKFTQCMDSEGQIQRRHFIKILLQISRCFKNSLPSLGVVSQGPVESIPNQSLVTSRFENTENVVEAPSGDEEVCKRHCLK